jgi:PD-(D/E)XK endonuclease
MTTLSTGAIGEHLVCADLRKQGFVAFMSPQDCAYDVVLDTTSCLLRVQVKTVNGPESGNSSNPPHWKFNLRRSTRSDKTLTYQLGDYDILALVALDINKIAYVAPEWNCTRDDVTFRQCQAITVRTHAYKYAPSGVPNSNYFEDLTLSAVLATEGIGNKVLGAGSILLVQKVGEGMQQMKLKPITEGGDAQ